MSGVRHYSNFMDRIVFDWETECHNWIGYKVCIGYGRLTYKGKQVLAHRLAKFLYGHCDEATFRNSKHVFMHRCDNPSCINPFHIEIGTQKDNIADRVRKGRSRKFFKRDKRTGRFI